MGEADRSRISRFGRDQRRRNDSSFDVKEEEKTKLEPDTSEKYIHSAWEQIQESLESIYALHDKPSFSQSRSLELVGDDEEVDDRFIDSILYVMPNLKVNELSKEDGYLESFLGPNFTLFALTRTR